MTISTYIAAKKSPAAAKKLAGPPMCEGGAKEVDLTLNEQYTGSILCGHCCSRFPVVAAKRIDLRVVMLTPRHAIPPELHTLRLRLEREASEAERRNEQRV